MNRRKTPVSSSALRRRARVDLNRRLIDIGQETLAATLPPRDIGSPTDDVAELENEIMEENLGLDPMAAVVSDPEDRSYYQDDSECRRSI